MSSIQNMNLVYCVFEDLMKRGTNCKLMDCGGLGGGVIIITNCNIILFGKIEGGGVRMKILIFLDFLYENISNHEKLGIVSNLLLDYFANLRIFISSSVDSISFFIFHFLFVGFSFRTCNMPFT